MERDLFLYRQQIAAQPLCVDPWFQENLNRLRSGEELAGRLISGSCLRIALEIALNMDIPPAALDTFGRIEEANAGLMEAIGSLAGSSLEEFIPFASRTILGRLESWRDKAA